MKKWITVAAFVLCVVTGHPALAQKTRLMAEQQARIAAAEWVQGPMFGCVDPDARANPACVAETVGSTRVTATRTAEILSHIRESLLAVRGDTQYCGIIREPTWILIWDSEESARWYGGYPVMINARTGMVMDCRS
jgi:hypothetical protein